MRRGTFADDYPVTTGLLLAILVLYLIEALWTMKLVPDTRFLEAVQQPDFRVELALGANWAPALRRGEVWRLITAAFLHASLLHIVFNGIALFDLGRLTEPLLGRERFAVVYLASAISGNLASAGHSMLVERGGALGASGAIFGLLGLLVGFAVRHRDRELRAEALRMVLYPVVFTLFMPNIDHAAHAGGFVCGALFGLITPRYVASRSARAWLLPALLLGGATLVALGIGIYRLVSTTIR
jgi:rhomboid protease GluP